jgi:threonine synthase
VNDANVLNLSVHGTFDDCQRIIKELFADIDFKHRYHLRAINSINIARVLAQTVYYFYAYFRLAATGAASNSKISFSVPTGNFGDIFAGYLAKRMGLPLHRLLLATNENNILERFVSVGVYEPGAFRGTHSPSMDIQVASNFERYLFYLYGEDPQAVTAMMAQFKAEGRIVVEGEKLKQAQDDFAAYSVGNEECLDTISRYHEAQSYLLDPHTACGAAAADQLAAQGEAIVVLSTAHPAKFDEAIRLRRISQTYPPQIQELFDKPQFQKVVGGTNDEIKQQLIAFF